VEHQHSQRLKVRFYSTATGNRTVVNELDGLGTAARAEMISAIRRRSAGTQFLREDEHVKGRIRAIRTTCEGCEYRALYALLGAHDEVLLCVHVLNKKWRKLPRSVIKLAEKRLTDWETRGRARQE
jgi:phage-related protein